MSEPSDRTRGLSDEHRSRFFAHLDRLPAKDRPVFGFPAQKPSLWQRLGGGTTYLLVLFFPDHHAVADALARFDAHGLAAFNRAELAPDAVRAFFVACSRGLPLPDGLFTDLE